jgi:transposase-like protein
METMERKKPAPVRSFTPEFKTEIVELCRRGDRSIGQVAKDFDLTETNVRNWVKQAEIDQGERPVSPPRTKRSSPACVGRTAPSKRTWRS